MTQAAQITAVVMREFFGSPFKGESEMSKFEQIRRKASIPEIKPDTAARKAVR